MHDERKNGPTILVVEDHEPLRQQLTRAFRRRGYGVEAARDYDEAVAVLNSEAPQYAVIDLRIPGKSGLELLVYIKQASPATKVVMLSGFGSIATAVAAMRLGATNFVPKPADADTILAAFVDERDNAESAANPNDATPSLAQAEWEHIHRVLSDCGGNLSEAARRLGLHRRSLQRKLKKLSPD